MAATILSVVLCFALSVAAGDTLTESRSRMLRDTEQSITRLGWVKHDSRYFIFINREMSWADAETYCLASNANLASIHTPAEYALIQELVKNRTGTYTRAWVGGTNAVETSKWFWSDGSRFFYHDWATGEPNNQYDREHCIEINFSDSLGHRLWNDKSCSIKTPFICGTRPGGAC